MLNSIESDKVDEEYHLDNIQKLLDTFQQTVESFKLTKHQQLTADIIKLTLAIRAQISATAYANNAQGDLLTKTIIESAKKLADPTTKFETEVIAILTLAKTFTSLDKV